MANKHLMIPGTGGITLMDQTGKDLGYPAKMKLGAMAGVLNGLAPKEMFKLLGMEHKKGQWAPVKTSLREGTSIEPRKPIRAAYNKVPPGFNYFRYDWRGDLRHNARLLLDYITQRKPTGGRWNLVGHSQGGLLIVLASKLLQNPDEFRKFVASVSLVGTPLVGTINAAYGLLVGDQFGDDNAAKFKPILRTWPALYQMMPMWTAVVNPQGKVADKKFQLTQPDGWIGHKDINPDLLQRARAAHKLLKHPLAHMEGDIDVQIIMATNRPTKLSLIRKASKLTTKHLHTGKGDTLVPFSVTSKQLDPLSRSRVLRKDNASIAKHSMLCSDPRVFQNVKDWIRK